MQDPQKTEKQPSTRIPKTWCDFLHKKSKSLEIKKAINKYLKDHFLNNSYLKTIL